MICTAISEKDFDTCLKLVSFYDLAEIRLDMTRFDEAQVKKLFSSHKNLVATCRPEGYTDDGSVENSHKCRCTLSRCGN